MKTVYIWAGLDGINPHLGLVTNGEPIDATRLSKEKTQQLLETNLVRIQEAPHKSTKSKEG